MANATNPSLHFDGSPRVRRLFAALLPLIFAGCSTSSNRFQYANTRQRDRDRLAELDRTPPPAPAIASIPAAPPPRQAEFDPPPASAAREQFVPPGNTAIPERMAPPFDPPRRDSDFAGNRTRTIETPRPGERGSNLVQAANGPELAGRVVNAFGRPEAGAGVSVVMASRPNQVIAEVASGIDGSFRVRFLEPGLQYRLTAALVSSGRRLVGSALATPPDTAVVIQLEREGTAGFSAIGNRPAVPATPAARAAATRAPFDFAHGQATNATPSTRDEGLGFVSARPSNRPIAPFAAITALTTDGRPARLGDVPGNLILLDFFGSWCDPCRRSIPSLNGLHRKYESRGLTIVGLACESGATNVAVQQARQAAAQLRVEYKVLACPMDAPSQAREYFQVEQYPTLILLDRGGRVLFRHSGADQESFRRLDSIVAANL